MKPTETKYVASGEHRGGEVEIAVALDNGSSVITKILSFSCGGTDSSRTTVYEKSH